MVILQFFLWCLLFSPIFRGQILSLDMVVGCGFACIIEVVVLFLCTM